MNLFKYVELYKSSSGFVGKSFFDFPEKRECAICKKRLVSVRDYTCSSECSKIFSENKKTKTNKTNSTNKFLYKNNRFPLTIHEFRQYIFEKYEEAKYTNPKNTE